MKIVAVAICRHENCRWVDFAVKPNPIRGNGEVLNMKALHEVASKLKDHDERHHNGIERGELKLIPLNDISATIIESRLTAHRSQRHKFYERLKARFYP